MSGPTSVPSAIGSPMGSRPYAAASRSASSSVTLVWAITRRIVVQRWPAVPAAEKTMPRTVRSRSADGRDDRGVVAAELQQGPAEAVGDPRPDRAAHPGRPGGAEQRDAGVVDQRLADVGAADDDLAEAARARRARRWPGRAGRAGGQGGQRGVLRRLPDHGVAADERERGVPRPDRDGEVEGADHADDAERVPGLHQPVAGALGGYRLAVELAGEADGEVADVDHLLDLAERLGGDLADLQADQGGEVLLVLGRAARRSA